MEGNKLTQMAELFSNIEFVQADVTYPACKGLRYLLNIAAFNPATVWEQAVARVMMNSLTAASYKNVLDVVTNLYPQFKNGENTKKHADLLLILL